MNQLVIMKNRQVVTTSLQIADVFEKQHGHILRDIENLKEDISNFGEMFKETSVPDSYNRARKAYYMNRDGFTLLAMGFTGKEALNFKLQYIQAFNKMEQSLIIKAPTTMKEALTLALEQQETIEKQTQLIAELQPKANYVDLVLQAKGLLETSQISKDYGMSAMRFNALLHQLGVQYKSNDQWLLYSKYQREGYTSSKSIPIVRSDGRSDFKLHTQWTQKGRLFIYELMKKNGILPTIEQ